MDSMESRVKENSQEKHLYFLQFKKFKLEYRKTNIKMWITSEIAWICRSLGMFFWFYRVPNRKF